jgi:hypothetical protein
MFRKYMAALSLIAVAGGSSVSSALPVGSTVKFMTAVGDGASVPVNASVTFIGNGHPPTGSYMESKAHGLVIDSNGKIYLKTFSMTGIVPLNGDVGVVMSTLTTNIASTGTIRLDNVLMRDTIACAGSCTTSTGSITINSTCEIKRNSESWALCGTLLTNSASGYRHGRYGTTSGSSCTNTSAGLTSNYDVNSFASRGVSGGTGTNCTASYPHQGDISFGNVLWEVATPADAYDKVTWTY